MPAEPLMITLAAIGAAFMTFALLADLCGMRITTALAVGLAGWCWLSAGEIAFAPHESRTAVAMHSPPQAAGAKWMMRIRPDVPAENITRRKTNER